MIGNNLKSLIYHLLWYFVILSLFFAEKTKPIIEAFVPDAMTRFLIIGIASVIFSLLFTILFMRPQGSGVRNFFSNLLLILLNIAAIAAAGYYFTQGNVTIFEVLLLGLFMLLQLFVISLVMQVKQRREPPEYY